MEEKGKKKQKATKTILWIFGFTGTLFVQFVQQTLHISFNEIQIESSTIIMWTGNRP